MSMQSQVKEKLFTAYVTNTYNWLGNDWFAKDSAKNEVRSIKIANDLSIVQIKMPFKDTILNLELYVDRVEKDSTQFITKLFTRDKDYYPVLIEYTDDMMQGALYYYWSIKDNHFLRAESLTLKERELKDEE